MKFVEAHPLTGPGYRKLFHSDAWRIAILNYTDELNIEAINWVERHDETDETFVLLDGNCTLIFPLVENDRVSHYEFIPMEKHFVYKINRGAYHTHVLSKDAKVLLVENESTCDKNSKRIYLNESERINLIQAFDQQ